MTSTARHPLATCRLLFLAVLALAAMLLSFAAVSYQHQVIEGDSKTVVDFHAFYVAGTLGLEGKVDDSYDIAKMKAAQRAFTGMDVSMPWTYPPPFTLFVTALAALPLGLAYGLFTGLTLLFYLTMLKRIAGDHLPGVMLAMLPVILLTVITGQNGFLTGGLVAMFLLAFGQRKASAGIPLGLMIVKPHLAAAISLLALVERRWQAMFIAAAIVITALLLPTLVFGLSIWPAFLAGVAESSAFLADGEYPLFRMTSIYAAVRSTGLSSDIAFAVHGAGAILTIALLLYGWWRKLPPQLLAASACAASLFVSPYNYDYDLCILGVGIAFVLPDLLQRTRALEQLGLLALCWFGTGYGLVASFAKDADAIGAGNWPLSLMAPPLLLLIALVALALRREVRARAEAHAPSASGAALKRDPAPAT
ncbi:glycosyltransferase family 87 protein [Blastomonas sp.]|uniref:glycosyltransferase family 87 protein n=1 Tax=Blastomonas sp. TaxID=1909299 RepID=UPI00391DF5C7